MMERDFERARRKANWNRVLAFFKGKPSLLLPFDLVRRQIDVRSVSYGGIQEIEIDRVIGSVNRYHEFDREFLPKRNESADRWTQVRRLFDSDLGFPPIKVYRVGDAFFVVDGNHRVSVARQLGMKTIEAEVIYFRIGVTIDKDTDIPDLIIKKEHSDFLKQTRLDILRPQQDIQFTRPGRYATILEHIDKRRYFLGLDLKRDIGYEEAVESWYDSLYRPLREILIQEGLPERFPKRTAADLYVWVSNHLHALREQLGDDIGLTVAAKDFQQSKAPSHLSTWLQSSTRTRLQSDTPNTQEDTPALLELLNRLSWMERKGLGTDLRYLVPARWLDFSASSDSVEVQATSFWRSSIERILHTEAASRIEGKEGEWSRQAVVYNLFVRASCAFDHDGDGHVSVLNRSGLRETGTFLKAIALLPYIRGLGCNVVHLLPICQIGQAGRKGTLGSPYAIADPYHLDEALSEPLVGLGSAAEFKAFVEAAHRLGIRIVVEFVLRTAARDSAWIPKNPRWFYWIREDIPDQDKANPGQPGYRSPLFPDAQLLKIKSQVHGGHFKNLPAPPAAYRAMFVQPPKHGHVMASEAGFIGITEDGTQVRIPGAFADWPPDDQQPAWSDVTYLRLYDHRDFNYIAYNTIRMYDEALTMPANVVPDLWDQIAGILPHFQSLFQIDGAMIDMGHALPRALMSRVVSGARGADPSFALWEEEFTVRTESKDEGYNALIGNLWWRIHRPESMRREVLEELATHGSPLPFFATPETHNTPRCASREGGVAQSRLSFILGAFLPAIPFIHSGFELGETLPVNTGLDFAPDEAERFPESCLPLYNAYAYNWLATSELDSAIRLTLTLREQFQSLIIDPTPQTMAVPTHSHEQVLAYVRHDAHRTILVVGNASAERIELTLEDIPGESTPLVDHIDGVACHLAAGKMVLHLEPWQCLVFTQDRTS
ncbi:MAG: hypothetical protein E4H08_08355 [Candidatus Atribacteria bacterium]|nr:MAG: hypothetical protein E4H08_08355 [Candidatus Atribacteria bacterium]